jgi:glycerol-3-phosphate dehydrogenase (NAD(P)+)
MRRRRILSSAVIDETDYEAPSEGAASVLERDGMAPTRAPATGTASRSRGLRGRALPGAGRRRAVVVGAGSFGTTVAVLLTTGGLRTILQARTREQAELLETQRENRVYLPGVELPRELRIESTQSAGLERADYVFLAVPSTYLGEVIAGLKDRGLSDRACVISLAKGLVPPDGLAPTVLLSRLLGSHRVACVGGPAHAQETVHDGAGLVAASRSEELARVVADAFMRAGVVCERSSDPVGVELAGAAKNAAALAAGATQAQGLNAAGAAAGHIFAEVWRFAETHGARPESMIGLAGTGDLVATALAPQSRNRRAGELLAAGVPAVDIPSRVGQAVEALESVRLLARTLESAGVEAPVTSALGRLIAAELPLEEWVALVRATVPPPARWRRAGFWRRQRRRVRWLWRRLSGGSGRR